MCSVEYARVIKQHGRVSKRRVALPSRLRSRLSPSWSISDHHHPIPLPSTPTYTSKNRTRTMAHSLSDRCTDLKLAYDACFNAWFEGYLRPAVSFASSSATPEQRAAYSKQKADEYESKCGKVWREYKECVQVSIEIRFFFFFGGGAVVVVGDGWRLETSSSFLMLTILTHRMRLKRKESIICSSKLGKKTLWTTHLLPNTFCIDLQHPPCT